MNASAASPMICRVVVRKEILAPRGVVHGGTLVSIADTMCGCGAMRCTARPVHLGKTTKDR
jgi:acyl-coenzyme A thioesterase PaaI-like protein